MVKQLIPDPREDEKVQSRWELCSETEGKTAVVQAMEVTQLLGQGVNLHRAGPAQARGEAPLPLSRRLAMNSGTHVYTISKALGSQGKKKKKEGIMTGRE